MQEINRSKVLAHLSNSIGKRCSFSFIKKNDEPRTIDGLLPYHFMDGATAGTKDKFPYILVLEINGGFRHVNLETLYEFSVESEKYKVV